MLTHQQILHFSTFGHVTLRGPRAPRPGLGSQDRMRLVRDMTHDGVEFGRQEHDRDRWPVWREWAAGAARSPSRTLAVERLKLLGVLTG